MEQIESKELRGVSLKTLYAIIVATASIVFTVFGTYVKLSGQIKDVQYNNSSDISKLQNQNTSDAKYNDLRIRVLETRVQILESKMK